ncbi:hypothetical protein NW754_001967 [Fusarium falciforme]|uniref:Zn(2)-C6 fungal-type domain-containing protein n=1 Tax=Fusarium falciforme TaxID=195108 RepID=A0A9W8V4G6_9HYPO|nr:hypothetical protein NW754_001967 [Fusarium falciforme]KAJ4195892.1 hypothetical protein NW755_002055 [Fusarium falciforme]KAJ4260186.1 hypothetical protein NW757_002138 [Fusarium falciforme]
MVNLGPSKGCHTCKQRRVKCDEGKPACQRCIRIGRDCGGYQTKPVKLKFKVQTTDTRQKSRKKTPTCRAITPKPVSLVSQVLDPPETDVALGFFLTNWAGTGRSLSSARGFFEVLAPVISSERPTSAAYMAVTAVATRLHGMWRNKDINFAQPHQPYADALARLRLAVKDKEERNCQATTLAALVLQFYENLFAVHSLSKASRVHHDGAVALMMSQEPRAAGMAIGNHLLCYVLHLEVSYALRTKKRFPTHIQSWVLQYPSTSLNSSSTLDFIGISIANLQYSFRRMFCGSDPVSTSHVDIGVLWSDIKAVEARLLGWLEHLPRHFHALRLDQVQDVTPHIPTYLDGCDVYPSVQVASISNTWRGYRLLLLKMKLSILQLVPDTILDTMLPREEDSDTQVELICNAEDEVQDMVDSICNSIPFYLGNQTVRPTVLELTNSKIIHPSYYNLEPWDERFVNFMTSDSYITVEAHRASAVAYGAWHAINTLSNVLALCAEDHGSFLAEALRPGQKDWVHAQFVRASSLLSLESSKAFQDIEKIRKQLQEGDTDVLVERVREGFRVSSGC